MQKKQAHREEQSRGDPSGAVPADESQAASTSIAAHCKKAKRISTLRVDSLFKFSSLAM